MATKKANATKATAKKAATKKAAAKKTATIKEGARDRRRDAAPPQPVEGSKLAREIAGLATLTKTQLWKRHKEVFGTESRSCNTKQLVDVIARRLVEQGKAPKATKPSEGDESTTAATTESATKVNAKPKTETGKRDPRTPKVGTVIEREHNGKVHKVKVLDDGFEYAGQKYRSLSGLAKEITGAIWNGWVWFGLVKHPSAAKKGATDAA